MKTEKMKILESALERKMPWGKFKGTPIEDIPSSYLDWVVDNNFNNNNDDLVVDIGFVLSWREDTGSHVE